MPAFSRTISRRRRRARLRATALPTFFDTVKPKRGGAVSARSRACNTNAAAGILVPVAAARKSARRFSRSMGPPRARASGTEALASPRTPRCDDLAAADRGGPGAEAVTALAHQFARLIGPFHGSHIQLVCGLGAQVTDERRRSVKKCAETGMSKAAGARSLAGLYGRGAAEVNATSRRWMLRPPVQIRRNHSAHAPASRLREGVRQSPHMAVTDPSW